MRRIFEQLPYFLPAEPAPFARLFLTEGIRREVAKGELLKRGGESQRLFFLESGLALITLRKRKITVRRSSLFCSPAARWVTLQPAWAHAAMYLHGRLKKASCASCRPRCSPPH